MLRILGDQLQHKTIAYLFKFTYCTRLSSKIRRRSFMSFDNIHQRKCFIYLKTYNFSRSRQSQLVILLDVSARSLSLFQQDFCLCVNKISVYTSPRSVSLCEQDLCLCVGEISIFMLVRSLYLCQRDLYLCVG